MNPMMPIMIMVAMLIIVVPLLFFGNGIGECKPLPPEEDWKFDCTETKYFTTIMGLSLIGILYWIGKGMQKEDKEVING